MSRAAVWIGRDTGGDVDGVLISAEGTGSYGAVMAERLVEVGYRVVEAPAPSGVAAWDGDHLLLVARQGFLPDWRCAEFLSWCAVASLEAHLRCDAEDGDDSGTTIVTTETRV